MQTASGLQAAFQAVWLIQKERVVMPFNSCKNRRRVDLLGTQATRKQIAAAAAAAAAPSATAAGALAPHFCARKQRALSRRARRPLRKKLRAQQHRFDASMPRWSTSAECSMLRLVEFCRALLRTMRAARPQRRGSTATDHVLGAFQVRAAPLKRVCKLLHVDRHD